MELSDEELCRRVAERDAPAFDLLVDRYQARAYRLARSILGSDADARDVSQDAFIRLYESAHRFDGRARFSTWFHRILVNLCIDYQRRNRWWQRLVPLGEPDDDPDLPGIDPPSPEPGPESEAIRGETLGQLRTGIGRLSPSQRAALMLQVEGMSSREIAAVLNCSEGTARVHVHRALAQLKKTAKER